MQKTKHQILLIDDELQWREYLTKWLSAHFGVLAVGDFPSGSVILKENPSIKLVILDVSTKPDRKVSSVTGLDMVNTLRSIRENLPIIIYTNFHLNATVPVSYLGVDAVFAKVEILQNDLFIKTIRTLINRTEKESKSEPTESISELRKAISEELEKFAPIKERTLSIPEEGNFELIKPLVGFKKDLETQISKFDYSKNVFLMMKFRPTNNDLSDYIIENLQRNGFNGIRADQNEWNITHDVYNPIAVLYCCKYGLALFDEAENHQAYSPNVAYELGVMHTQNKECLILRHSSLPPVPFDLIKNLYHTYDRDLEVKRIISNWIAQIRHRKKMT